MTLESSLTLPRNHFSVNHILIIDDEEKLRTLMARIISMEGYEVYQASDIKGGLRKLENTDIDVVLCDVKLPDGNGIDAALKIKSVFPLLEVILLTAYGNIPDGVRAIKNGAFDYITKGDDNNKIVPLIQRACEKVELAKRIASLEKQLGSKYSFDSILGSSKAICQAIDLAKRVSQTDTTVLLTGETGTGKEVFAQSIHQESLRKSKPFVAINCSAFGKELLESEMFGHKAGAFTGAQKDQKGLFEEANLGTIFLDEIGEMSLELQAKLLRVIETGEFLKVGESKPTKTNVRIIAATHRDLQKEIDNGHFRQDLFYRLSVFQIQLPALRERAADISILAKHFIKSFAIKSNKRISTISADFFESLSQHSFPGNIRELKNIIERAVILSNNGEIGIDLLPLELQVPIANPDGQKSISAFNLSSIEKLHIQKVLNYTCGNKSEAAKLLGIGAATLYRKIDEYKL